jgi:hypothetical protein
MVRHVDVPVPSLMVLVSPNSEATKISEEVMRSAASVTCSPMKPSAKPSLSAIKASSRSSLSTCA